MSKKYPINTMHNVRREKNMQSRKRKKIRLIPSFICLAMILVIAYFITKAKIPSFLEQDYPP